MAKHRFGELQISDFRFQIEGKRIAWAVVLLLICAAVIAAPASLKIGEMTLEGDILDWDGQKIIAKGHASFTAAPSKTPLKVGESRLESIKAGTITIVLTTGKSQKLKEASATGEVVIRAKRADQDESGTKTLLRDVYATAQSATMPQAQDTIKLTGNAFVKVTEPNVAQPIATLSGKTMTVSLKDHTIRVEGEPDKQAEFTGATKEGPK